MPCGSQRAKPFRGKGRSPLVVQEPCPFAPRNRGVMLHSSILSCDPILGSDRRERTTTWYITTNFFHTLGLYLITQGAKRLGNSMNNVSIAKSKSLTSKDSGDDGSDS